jgi:hypothetical protein
LKDHLRRMRLPFQELDVSRNRRAHKDWLQLGARGVPVLLVGNRRLDGYDPKRLTKLLTQAGIDTPAGENSRPEKRR